MVTPKQVIKENFKKSPEMVLALSPTATDEDLRRVSESDDIEAARVAFNRLEARLDTNTAVNNI